MSARVNLNRPWREEPETPTMLLLQALAAAPYVVQVAIDRLSLVLNEPPVLAVVRRALLQVCGCG
jgi:hypothetical protein